MRRDCDAAASECRVEKSMKVHRGRRRVLCVATEAWRSLRDPRFGTPPRAGSHGQQHGDGEWAQEGACLETTATFRASGGSAQGSRGALTRSRPWREAVDPDGAVPLHRGAPVLPGEQALHFPECRGARPLHGRMEGASEGTASRASGEKLRHGARPPWRARPLSKSPVRPWSYSAVVVGFSQGRCS